MTKVNFTIDEVAVQLSMTREEILETVNKVEMPRFINGNIQYNAESIELLRKSYWKGTSYKSPVKKRVSDKSGDSLRYFRGHSKELTIKLKESKAENKKLNRQLVKTLKNNARLRQQLAAVKESSLPKSAINALKRDLIKETSRLGRAHKTIKKSENKIKDYQARLRTSVKTVTFTKEAVKRKNTKIDCLKLKLKASQQDTANALSAVKLLESKLLEQDAVILAMTMERTKPKAERVDYCFLNTQTPTGHSQTLGATSQKC